MIPQRHDNKRKTGERSCKPFSPNDMRPEGASGARLAAGIYLRNAFDCNRGQGIFTPEAFEATSMQYPGRDKIEEKIKHQIATVGCRLLRRQRVRAIERHHLR